MDEVELEEEALSEALEQYKINASKIRNLMIWLKGFEASSSNSN